MTKKKNLNKTIVTFLGIATLGAGAGAAAIASAATAPANTVPTTQNAGKGMGLGRRGPPGIIGTVTLVNGMSITVKDRSGSDYSVDLTSAKITKNVGGTAPTTITATDINIGDTIGVRGQISGSSVTATFAMDGISLTIPDAAPVGDKSENKQSGFGGHRGPGLSGKVSAVSGTTVTITAADGTTYTVDAASAKLSKLQTITTSDLVVGDEVGVRGSISGTSVTATDIMDGLSR